MDILQSLPVFNVYVLEKIITVAKLQSFINRSSYVLFRILCLVFAIGAKFQLLAPISSVYKCSLENILRTVYLISSLRK